MGKLLIFTYFYIAIWSKEYEMEGYANIKPVIKNIKFNNGKICICLQDGRNIITPVNQFQSIKNLSLRERKQWQILDGIGFTFKNCDELFHISQFLGVNNLVFDRKFISV